MKQVVIGMKNGKPYVISAPKKVEVVFKKQKRKSFLKSLKTIKFHFKKMLFKKET